MPTALAANLTVTSTADVATNFGACGNTGQTTSSGSLREAVCAANNAGASASTITVAAGTYTLANGELQMGKVAGSNITLTGAGAGSTIISGNNASRVFNLDPNIVGGVTTSISGVTITGGADSTFGGAGIIAGRGTAQPTGDTLTISNSTITNNHVNSAAATSAVAWRSPAAADDHQLDHQQQHHERQLAAPGCGTAPRAPPRGEGLTISGTTFSGNTANASCHHERRRCARRRDRAVLAGRSSTSAVRDSSATPSPAAAAGTPRVARIYLRAAS